MAAPVPLTLRVNGQAHALVLDAEQPLLSVLRNDLGLNGPKYGCGLGECGAGAESGRGQDGQGDGAAVKGTHEGVSFGWVV